MENKINYEQHTKTMKEFTDYLKELQVFVDTYLKKDFSIQQYVLNKSQDEQTLVPDMTELTFPCESESDKNTVYYF